MTRSAGMRLSSYFNSRPSARGDFIAFLLSSRNPRISIHAPPRGATGKGGKKREGRGFQFTPLREGRRILKPRLKKAYSYFNSRPSARGDRPAIRRLQIYQYFNSRPSARGDRLAGCVEDRAFYFNSRPSARGDFLPNKKISRGAYFNSRPSARGDARRSRSLVQAQFQFTPLREGRPA